MSHFLAQLQARPASTAFLGSVSGWASVEFLRGAQIIAALLAIAVSFCALILTAPKAVAQVRHWVYRNRLLKAASKTVTMRKSRKYLGASNETPYKQHEGINGIRQKWTSIWLNKLISNPKTGKQIRESLMKDQYGNHYVTYQTVLKDGEWYETGEWIRPSTIALYGGFTVHLLDWLRGKAFLAFSQVEAKL